MRTIYSLRPNPAAEHTIGEILPGDYYVNDEQCEGLTFASKPDIFEAGTNQVRRYAFKLSDKKLRLIIMVQCDVSFWTVLGLVEMTEENDFNTIYFIQSNGLCLINRAIHTSRLYTAILAELRHLDFFDIALLINVDRRTDVGVTPFNFSDTIAQNIYDRSENTAHAVNKIRELRPDLRWFTDLCAPDASYRAYAHNYYPMHRCLWIVDAYPPRFY